MMSRLSVQWILLVPLSLTKTVVAGAASEYLYGTYGGREAALLALLLLSFRLSKVKAIWMEKLLRPGSPIPFKYENDTDLPSTMDWRTKGAVTLVKDQGQCGCCWVFSSIATTEGITQLSTDNMTSLSDQELVDCATSGVDKGFEVVSWMML